MGRNDSIDPVGRYHVAVRESPGNVNLRIPESGKCIYRERTIMKHNRIGVVVLVKSLH